MFLSTRWKAAKDLGVDMTLLGWTPDELSAAVAPPANPGPTDPDVISQRKIRRSASQE